MSRAAFIAIEGIDGAGTTSQAHRLIETLTGRGLAAHFTAEPSEGPVGRVIRALLGQVDDPPDPAAMALLFAADRIHHLQNEIDPLLAKGTHVFSDRYVMSSLAYQSVDQELAWVRSLNRNARPPDLTVLMRVDPEVAAERRGVRGSADEIYDRLHFQRRVAENYDRLAEELTEHNVVIVDAGEDFEPVAARLEAVVWPVIQRHETP